MKRDVRWLTWTLAFGLLWGAGPAPAALADKSNDDSCWPSQPGTDPALCPPDDPKYREHWEYRSDIPPEIDRDKMHPAELELGAVGISLDRAWQYTIGRDDVVIAVLDSGIRWRSGELLRKFYLNREELPLPEGSTDHDANGDGIFNIEDYAGDTRVLDANENGVLDPGDLINAFSDCVDDDRNGYPDDICGYDFFTDDSHCGLAGWDNDAWDATDFGHGTGIASSAAADTNNGAGDVGVCPNCRVLPVRVGDSFVVDANNWARGALFAVRSGASVIASATGSFNNTPAARYAVDYAYDRGVPIIASAADEFSYHHNFPSVYNHALYVNAIRFNHTGDYRKASTFWGVNPCTNFGARVWITVPAESCSSGATSRLSGVVGLVQSAARDAGQAPLHTEEIYQLLRATADDLDNSDPDWGRARYPARRGFDQLYGYGRLNAQRAVEAVIAGDIPPIADLHSPEWFTIVSPRQRPLVTVRGAVGAPRTRHATYRLDYALGVEPAEDAYVSVSRGRLQGQRVGVLGVLNFARLPLPKGPAPTNREERDRFSVSLRLTVTDDQGRRAESRRSFFAFDDPSWKPHFPLALGASGEAGPTLADLDGDGSDEIILPLADGRVRLLNWQPVGIRWHDLLLDPGPALAPPGAIPRRVARGLGRESAIRGVAVGDIHGRGEISIVVASYEGKVYVFSPRGERRAPFPVSLDRELGRGATKSQPIESGILSRPVLAELDGRPGSEIVVSSLDGHVYVWRGDGSLLDGFPVRVENPDITPTRRTKLVSTPAVGDVDGDGVPEIVVGSNGTRDDLSAAYAIRALGNLHPDGALLPGWPVELSALRAELLPTLADGIPMGPLLVDVDGDGDSEVVLYAVTSNEIVLVDHRDDGPSIVARLETTPSDASGFVGTTFIAGTGSPLLIDTDLDGAKEVYAPLLPFRMLTLRTKPGIPLEAPLALGGWELGVSTAGQTTVPMISGYPRPMEDLMIFAQPAAEDVDGDGVVEVLMGSGGYLLHAFRRGGQEAEGFPKFTGGWIFSAPAAGDIDGDGTRELVAVTREGYLFAWALDTPAPDPSAVSSTKR